MLTNDIVSFEKVGPGYVLSHLICNKQKVEYGVFLFLIPHLSLPHSNHYLHTYMYKCFFCEYIMCDF